MPQYCQQLHTLCACVYIYIYIYGPALIPARLLPTHHPDKIESRQTNQVCCSQNTRLVLFRLDSRQIQNPQVAHPERKRSASWTRKLQLGWLHRDGLGASRTNSKTSASNALTEKKGGACNSQCTLFNSLPNSWSSIGQWKPPLHRSTKSWQAEKWRECVMKLQAGPPRFFLLLLLCVKAPAPLPTYTKRRELDTQCDDAQTRSYIPACQQHQQQPVTDSWRFQLAVARCSR